MSHFRGISLDLFKSKVVLFVSLGVVVLLIVWWFAWMAPEANKLASVNAQVTTDQQQVAQLNAQLQSLKAEKKLVLRELPYLKKVTTAIPPTEDPPGIVDSLNTLATQTNCDLLAVTPADTPSPSGVAGLSDISVSFTLSGVHGSVFTFLRNFYKMKRLMTISSVTLTPSSSNANILAGGDGQQYTLTVSADAYTTYVTPATTS